MNIIHKFFRNIFYGPESNKSWDAEYIDREYAFGYCRSVINSCRTLLHCETAENMVFNFYNLFNNIEETSGLIYELDCKRDDIILGNYIQDVECEIIED